MTSSATVTRFANALVDVVLGPKGLDPTRALANLRSFNDLVVSSPELRTVLASPAVSPLRKRQLVKRFCDMLEVHPVIRNFLLVLSDHRRAAALPAVIEVFELRLDERMGFMRAEVKSAVELPEDQKQVLAGELARLAGTQVRARYTVDPSLIGGATAQLGSTVYDGSVRGQLETLRSRLAFK